MTREITTLKRRIGLRIRHRRDEVRISQEDLADAADMTPTYLSQIENGKRNPSLEALFRIATALAIDLADLIKA